MATIRRYGPALITSQVMPSVNLGRGREAQFAAFRGALDQVNEFIRPAVTEIMQRRGQQELLDQQGNLAQFGLESTGNPGSYSLGMPQISPESFGGDVTQAITSAAQRHGVDPLGLSVIAQLESGGDPNARNPASSASGLFQFITGTAQQYGLTNPFDAFASADAGARLYRDNQAALRNGLGREPTIGELYLAHQQGAQGALRLLAAPAPALASSIVGEDAVRLNGGDPATMTAQAFAGMWSSRADELAGSTPGQADPTYFALQGGAPGRRGPTQANAGVFQGLAASGKLVPGLANINYDAIGTRDDPLQPQVVMDLNTVVRQLGANFDVRVTSAGQPTQSEDPDNSDRTGSVRHDHGGAADVVLVMDGQEITPESNPEIYERFFYLAAPYFPGMGHYAWGVHVGGGSAAFWGPDTTGATANPRFARAAAAGRRGATFNTSTPGMTVEGTQGYELQVLNANTFEPRVPFTVRDQAFNAAADRVISGRASAALEQGMQAAIANSNGDLDALRSELERVRQTVTSQLPDEMPGLQVELQEQFDRGRIVAERQFLDAAQQRVIARQEEAATSFIETVGQQAQRMAISGATGEELAAHMAQATDQLAQFGPREGFVLAGRTYAPDPTRAGTMSPSAIAERLAGITDEARTLMIRSDFMRSQAPGQYVEEFRRAILAGESPLPVGQSLTLLSQMETQARQAESQRRAAANAERERLERETTTTINAYVAMTEAGVPVAIPQGERAQILANLAPYPELQRQAELEFAVADAAVATHGMSGPELMAYVDGVRADMRTAIENGQLDLAGAEIIESLSSRIRSVQDAVTAESVGLPLVQQLAMNGVTFENVDYDGLREQAAGNPDLLNAISEVEAFHRDIALLEGMTADERAAVLEGARESLAILAAEGQGFGQDALMTQRVVGRLGEWSERLTTAANNDALQYAEMIGMDVQPLVPEGEEPSFAAIGAGISLRVRQIGPMARREGAETVVPLSAGEREMIAEAFDGASRMQRIQFLASMSDLGQDQATAIYSALGATSPTLFAAGNIYEGGNQEAARLVVMGDNGVSLEGGGPTEIAAARVGAIGALMEADLVTPESVERLDRVALSYARGLAWTNGSARITPNDIEAGYQIALGRQADGTGGLFDLGRFGPVVLPPGFDGREVSRALRNLDDERLTNLARGIVMGGDRVPLTAEELVRSIDVLIPSPEDPNVLVPMTDYGGAFLRADGMEEGLFTIDLRELGQ